MARYALLGATLLFLQSAEAFLSAPQALRPLHASLLPNRLACAGRPLSAKTPALRCSASTDESFTTWIQENGGKTSCIATTSSASGRGLTAKEAIKAGQEACLVPVKLMMTEETALKALGGKAADLDAETAIALQLIKERSEGSSSFFAPWLAVLPTPEGLDVPLMWKEEERAWLEGCKVGEDVEELSENLEDEFDQLVEGGWTKEMVPGLNLDSYRWATSVVSSRAISHPKLPGGVALVPLADFATHSSDGGKTEVSFEGMFREPHVRLRTGQAVEKGGGVSICFPGAVVGGSDNSALLFKRGLCDLSVAGGSYDMEFGVSPLDRFRDDKEDIMEQAGFAPEMIFTLSSDPMDWDNVPQSYWDMMAYIRLVCIAGQDAFLLESVFRGDVWGFMQYPVSQANEKLVLETLIGTIEGALEGFSTTEGEDARAQSTESLPLRQRMAAAARLGERKALGVALQTFLSDFETLDSKEYYQERRLRELNLDRPLDESEIIDPDMPIGRGAIEQEY